ncbi:DNA polymerase III subunit delta [Planctomycetales bacterium]|nr:DNA polymerase III subunit delta [Planctomycetales bacterium]
MQIIAAHEFLWEPKKYPPQGVCVVFGDDAFLKSAAIQHLRQLVLSGDDAEFSLSRFAGSEADMGDVLKELATTGMFGGGRRFVQIDDAEKFLSKKDVRAALEKYADHPNENGILLLDLTAFPANTNLYKKVINSGLIIEAKTLKEKDCVKWLVRWSKHQYQTLCQTDAAEMILERVGLEHGLLDQELAKLSLMVSDPKTGITVQIVEEAVGSWRSRTAFEMLDLALDGKTAAAVRLLDNLLAAGEQPIGVAAQISATLRKMGIATRIYLDAEKQNRKIAPKTALEQAGFNPYFLRSDRGQRSKLENQFINLGRTRGSKLPDDLVKLDLNLKGDSRISAKLILEMFLVKLSNVSLRK